ncbi:MAG: spermidine/putrescine ABC transporter substrate-binding protein [Gaiellaceae bacterium]
MSERPIWERRYDRRGFVAVSAMTAFLAACGGSTTAEEEPGGGTTTATDQPQLTGELFYYNWADYVNPETYDRFTQETGVTVKKDFYPSNEDLQAKLQAGARGYDIVVPTGYMTKILVEGNLLQEIDWSRLPTVEANIDPKFRGLPYDPDDRYSVPKDWGTTGFVYRTDLFDGTLTSWADFYEAAMGPLSKKVTVLDSYPEVIGSALKKNGFSYNSEDEGELEIAKGDLLALKPHILAITSSEYRQMVIAGRAAMALGWNGDGALVVAEKPAEYVVPEEGSEFWVDTYAIPVGANNPDAAYAWIDFAYQPEIGALETEYHNYGSTLQKALLEGVIDPDVLANEDVFPSDEVVAKLEPNNYGPEGDSLRQRIWTEFKSA